MTDFKQIHWDPTITCEVLTSVLLTVQSIERRVKNIATLECKYKAEADEAITAALVGLVCLSIFSFSFSSLQYGQPEDTEMPKPPFYWIHHDIWPEIVLTLDIKELLPPYMAAYFEFYTAPTDTKAKNDLGGYWKFRNLPVPGGKVWRHVKPRDIADLYNEQGKEIPPRAVGQIMKRNGKTLFSFELRRSVDRLSQ